jgi:hypothetical protein
VVVLPVPVLVPVPVVVLPVPVVVEPVAVVPLPVWVGLVMVPGVLAAGLVGLVLCCAPAFMPTATKAAAATAARPPMLFLFMLIS